MNIIQKIKLSKFYKRDNLVKLFLLCLVFSSFLVCKKVDAASLPISGAMWSSTIGWVSASSTGAVSYKLELDNVGRTVRGQAWSNNIGWVSFDPGYVSGCGSAVAYDPSTGYLSGFARAIAGDGTAVAGGWDGCIGFDVGTGANHPQYNASTGLFSGFAWGNVNVGWLKLDGLTTTLPPLTVRLTANPSSVQEGQNTTLTWVVNGTATACSALAQPSQSDWNPATPVTPLGGTKTVTPTVAGSGFPKTVKYILTCQNTQGQWIPDVSTTVTITAPTYSCSGSIPSGNSQCSGTQTTGLTSSASWTLVSSCPTDSTNICKYVADGGGAGDCEPYLASDENTPITSAKVGELVVWKIIGGTEDVNWSSILGGATEHIGATYPIRYSTIGKKAMYAGGVQCEVGVGGENLLPITSQPIIKPF